MKKMLIIGLLLMARPLFIFAQTTEDRKQLAFLQDSLSHLGHAFINDEIDIDRKVANATFIKTLVSALKIPNSYLFPFDSLKYISIQRSPDNRFRIFSWHIINMDGSYRYYGAIQMNSTDLKLTALADFSPLIQKPQDTVTDNRTWYGAQYYKIIPVNALTPYYVLLGWKGNNVESTKKVIDVLWFKDGKAQFGLPVFEEKGKNLERVIFEYSAQASMLLHYVPEQNLIVFDNLASPDPKTKNQPTTFGPDLSYNAFKLKNGKWVYIDNIDMRNIPSPNDAGFNDPKLDKIWDKTEKPPKQDQN